MSSKQYSMGLKNAIINKNEQSFLDLVKQDYKKSCKRIKPEFTERTSLILSHLNTQYQFAKLVESCDANQHRAIISWFLTKRESLTKLMSVLKKEDEIDQVLSILDTIRRSDPVNFEPYFNLALAVAVVWDTPSKNIHAQMGSNTLKYDSNPLPIYTYFKTLYLSGKAKIRYVKLDVNDLIFVVNTPVPVSELEWAKKNVRGSAKSWRKKYAEIEYDTPRLAANEMVWPSYNKVYSLENIEEYGGICVDQAYFATITGRANGIPTMYFSGKGRSGGHAWFGYFLAKNNWITDAGKYSAGNYAIGYTTNPQTNHKISNHDLDLLSNRKFSSKSYQQATCYIIASKLLSELAEPELALEFARLTRNNAPLYQEPWHYLEKSLLKNGDQSVITNFYTSKLRTFKDYNDIHSTTKIKFADYLLSIKKGKQASRIFKKQVNDLGDERTDLAVTALLTRFDLLRKTKQVEKAKSSLEDFITENIDEYALVFTVMQKYLDYSSEEHFEKEACRFIKKIYSKMKRNIDDLVALQLMALMKKSCLLAGDVKATARINKSIAKFEREKEKKAEKTRSHDKRREKQEEQEKDDYRNSPKS
jgi:hypothetical protein